jgi:hypothetical protein
LYTNSKGEGAVVVNQDVRVSKGGVSYETSMPAVIELTKEQVKSIEIKYGVKVTEAPAQDNSDPLDLGL